MSTAYSPFYEAERPAQPVWRIGSYEIVRCVDSGLVYLKDPPSDEALAEFYSREYFEGEASRRGYASYEADEPVLRVNFKDLLGHVRSASKKPTAGLDLLDYGCAYGYFLDEAREYFQSVRGLEMSEDVAAIGRDRFGLDIESGPDARIPPDSLDVITMWDVVEHLRAPATALRACHAALRQGGRIHLTTGDLDSPLARALGRRWRLVNPPQHVTYFSGATLGSLLERSGFRVVSTRRIGKKVSLGFFLFILGYLTGRSPEKWTRRLGALSDKSVYVNLHDVVYMTAERI